MGRKRDDDCEDDTRAAAAAGRRTRQRTSAGQTLLWVVALLLSLVLLQQLATRPARSARSALTAREGVLLDGRDVAKPLPLVFPNGAKSAHRCDLPALRYQCELDRATGCRAYPQLFPMRELLSNWSPDEPTRPPAHTFESICRFDLSDPYELQLAHMFHQMEVPFIAYGVPQLTRASQTWTDENMAKLDEPPTYASHWWTYQQFLAAVAATKTQADDDHQYFYLQLKAGDINARARFVYDDLDFMDAARVLSPDSALLAAYGNMFIRDPQDTLERGMRCRFGMQGIITEGHFDSALNMIAMVRGAKRYIVAPPSACSCLDLLTAGPSARHTRLDWSNMSALPAHALECPATEVVVRAGDVLYMPSYWYHHIVSLDESIQCNVRSGTIAREDTLRFLDECGFEG
ncbi:hypothetical protein PybrP1_002136 [[Pythium] brassicae (nom. inval.)]|nr:hypothetical protein PybrP1_002136 [[Pythium] brassicae (nom. inval.)]